MPTTRPRVLVTETDELAAALDAASERWPGLSRPQLLVRLALEGEVTLSQRRAARQHRRREAIARHSGVLTGHFGESYLDTLRHDWPA